MAPPSASRTGWQRRYPPLATVIVALALAVFALPSALNLPLANPAQTLEYAPVPGNPQNSSQQGNFAGLGQGTTSTLGGIGDGGLGLLPALGPPPLSSTSQGIGKHCVGNPPRQTEDPLSPPCVGYFNGDNGGATYTGVSAGEVVVLYYLDGSGTDYTTSTGPQPIPTSRYVDMGTPADPNDGIWSAVLHIAQLDFNTRYQTYKRKVHIWAYFDASGAGTGDIPQQRKADAADNWNTRHPFAVIAYPQYDSQDYLSAMAAHGVVALSGSKMENTGSIGAPADYFRTNAGKLWAFEPAIEYRAHEFADLVCTEVANRPVRFSGNLADMNKPRKLGLLMPKLANYPEQRELADAIKADLAGCDSSIEIGAKYDNSGGGQDANFIANATQQMAQFKKDGVTTVIDPGQGAYDSRGANSVGYYPEWIIAGDGLADATIAGSLNDQAVFKNAWLMTTWVHRGPSAGSDACVESAQEAAPQANVSDILQFYCPLYDSTRQLFTAIQVAGPKLTPASIDQGFHAIPHVASSSNRVPACFYGPGDYTCVKDAMLEWWDPSGTDPEYGGSSNGASGCWRLVEDGARHLGSWPKRELYDGKGPADACNGQF